MNKTIQSLIEAADQAIREERFDDLMEYYTDDAVLIVKPGTEARGKKSKMRLYGLRPVLKTASYQHRAK